MGEHNYVIDGDGWEACTRCGMVRNRDKVTECRGALPAVAQREQRIIVGVAYRLPESVGGHVWSSPRPARHLAISEATQGFVLGDGTFVDRFEALAIARANGQLIRKTEPADRLFSEDLW